MRRLGSLTIAASLFLVSTLSSLADDWVAKRLRGGVFTLVDGAWVQLHRGDVVPDGQAIRTQNNARVTLVRGAETVEVGPTSYIEIEDRDGHLYTTVKQWFGTVDVKAEVRDVNHFAVVNTRLAAVVKGTHFTVKSNLAGAQVGVERGHVGVVDVDTHQSVIVTAGQSASTDSSGGGLTVEGDGQLPVIRNAQGTPVASGNAATTPLAAEPPAGSPTAGNGKKDKDESSSNSGGAGNGANGNEGGGNGGPGNGDQGNGGGGNGGGNGNDGGGNGNQGGGNGNKGGGNSSPGNGNQGNGNGN
jgi:hypothetical protein